MYKILIIDDLIDIHEAIKAPFQSNKKKSKLSGFKKESLKKTESAPDYTFDSSMNGQEGIDKYREQFEKGEKYDLIICDIRMPPGINGKETIERVFELNNEALVIFCSAYSDFKDSELRSISNNNDNIHTMGKPFSIDDVRNNIKYMLGKL